MKEIISIICDPDQNEEVLQQIALGIDRNQWIQLTSSANQANAIPKIKLPEGPGFIINSGGSIGGPHQCLLPCSHLDKSDFSTGSFLKDQGLHPQECQIFNSLPINHVSGLMPWWRSRCWGANYKAINPKLMRNPKRLEEITCSAIKEQNTVRVTSLVPTQLSRLLKEPAGIRWLQSFYVIWIGGSLLPHTLAATARKFKIRLAPCYGATETTAMVTAQSPDDFLLGLNNYGNALVDIELRLGANSRLEVKTSRLALGSLINGGLQPIANQEGWWTSGDIAELVGNDMRMQLKIIGRADTAINSGGEIVYPESLREKLLDAAHKAQIPIEEILLIPISDDEWGKRLVALVRLSSTKTNINLSRLFYELKALIQKWPSYEKPISWHNCPELKTNSVGKWDLSKWSLWVDKKIDLNK